MHNTLKKMPPIHLGGRNRTPVLLVGQKCVLRPFLGGFQIVCECIPENKPTEGDGDIGAVLLDGMAAGGGNCVVYTT